MSLTDSDCPPGEWTSPDTEVLLNPWMPEAQRTSLMAVQQGLPALTGHVWLTTSGSSGVKWVALSKEALLASARAVNEHLDSSASDIWALALPTFHVGGLGILARGFQSGAKVNRYTEANGKPRWDAQTFHTFLTDIGATLTALVPTQIHDLVRSSRPAPSALRAVVAGGGALSQELYRSARSLGWPVLPSYGLSECCSQVATAPLSSLTPDTDQDDPPLVLLSHVSARVSSDGRFLLRSQSLLTGYGLPGDGTLGNGPRFVDPKEDGWFLTEDRGTIAGDVLAIQGRIGDFVKIGGESVDVATLQRHWARLQGPEIELVETILVAAADERLGAAIHLIALRVPGQQGSVKPQVEQAIRRFNQEVLPFERIQKLHWVEAMPRSPLGKLLRKELLALAELSAG